MYADANEGSASGGHLALRLADRTYHFGYHEPGFLRLDRDDSSRFERVYGTLENRNLRILRVAVSEETFDRLRRSFNERHLQEEVEFEALSELQRDLAFLEEWRVAVPTVEVRAAGYFAAAPAGSPPATRGVLARVRRRVAARWGGDFLARRRRASFEVLAGLARGLAEPVPPLAQAGRHPVDGYGPARRAARAQSLVEALELLEAGGRLEAGATIEVPTAFFPMDGPTRAWLRTLSRSFEDHAVDLAGSRRRDAGYALLVVMARLLALEQSLQSDRLILLDPFPPDPTRMSVPEIEARGGSLPRFARDLRDELGRVRRALAEKGRLREADYATLERVGARLHEIERARKTGSEVRVAEGPAVPARSVRRPLSIAGRPSGPRLRERITLLRARHEELEGRLGQRHRYHLLDHNCASELFVQVERAVGNALGGRLSSARGLRFIPFVAAAAVAANYRVDEIVDVPSHRRRRLATMTKREGIVASLRESNVLTSTAYRPNPEDSAFLFFTDGPLPPRPLLGAANLVYGLGAALAGLPAAAWDRGALLAGGLRGALWSLPEIAFVNVRKGSYSFEPAPDRSRADAPEVSQSPST